MTSKTSKISPAKKEFEEKIVPLLRQLLSLKGGNPYLVPRVKYVKVNCGIGTLVSSGKDYESVVKNIERITGQRPVVNKSRMAISNFKLKEGTPNGVSVTLRGARMYDFLKKLVNVVFPRIRDFRGMPQKAFDGRGNYSVGITEHTVFPEIDPEDVSKIHGLQVTIITTAKNDDEGRALLKAMNFPFKKD